MGFHRLGEQGLVPHNVHGRRAGRRLGPRDRREQRAGLPHPRDVRGGDRGVEGEAQADAHRHAGPGRADGAAADARRWWIRSRRTVRSGRAAGGHRPGGEGPAPTSGMDVPPGGFDPTVVPAAGPADVPHGGGQTPMSTPRVILPRTDELVYDAPQGAAPARSAAGSRRAHRRRRWTTCWQRCSSGCRASTSGATLADGLGYLLDLAMEKIPVEAGSVFSSELVSGDLRFVVVRGPKAQEILEAKIVIPAGTGIVGFLRGGGRVARRCRTCRRIRGSTGASPTGCTTRPGASSARRSSPTGGRSAAWSW